LEVKVNNWREGLAQLVQSRSGKPSISRIMLMTGWCITMIYVVRTVELILWLPPEQFVQAVAYVRDIIAEVFIFCGGVYAWAKHLDSKNGEEKL
jgi:hypothetical protein